MSTSASEEKPRRGIWLLPAAIGVALLALVAVLLVGGRWRERAGAKLPSEAVTPSPGDYASSSATPLPTCSSEPVTDRLDLVLSALEEGAVGSAQAELEAALLAYAGMMELGECRHLALELLGILALVNSSAAWESALQSRSANQADEAARLAALAAELAPDDRSNALAASLVAEVEQRSAALRAALSPGRVITRSETIATELAGGLHPLCAINSLIKPLLAERDSLALPPVTRMVVYSDTVFALTGGHLMIASLEQVHGPEPVVRLRPADPREGEVAGATVEELVDLAPAANGDLMLLEKSGRLLRRDPVGVWTLERSAQPAEMLVAVARYGSRSYLLDPVGNQIWRYPAETEDYLPTYFADGIARGLSRAADLAIDGSIYVAFSDGRMRRYYGGVEDPGFRPDTDLGSPVAVFLPDEPGSTLVYVVDGRGRRLLGLNRETGSYSLGFALRGEDVGLLTAGAIRSGRLYLTDSTNLYVTILTPAATSAVDCPALPFPPFLPLDRPELRDVDYRVPVDSSLPATLSHYPGGRWPQLGYGVLDGLAFTGLPYSDTVRAIAPGTIVGILRDPPPLSLTDLAVITATGRVPLDLNDALWGKQVWIDHGNGVMSRYGGLETILPSLGEGQPVHRLAILGFAGEGAVLLGLLADDHYVGYGRLMPETVATYGALFEQD